MPNRQEQVTNGVAARQAIATDDAQVHKLLMMKCEEQQNKMRTFSAKERTMLLMMSGNHSQCATLLGQHGV
jgi:hypothetical protein